LTDGDEFGDLREEEFMKRRVLDGPIDDWNPNVHFFILLVVIFSGYVGVVHFVLLIVVFTRWLR
jgi:hypothetical protein